MAKQESLPELEKALTFYSEVLESVRKKARLNKDLLEAQEHLVYSISKINKVIKDMTKTLNTGE